ncbi:MAG: hypothetical protein ACRDE5_11585, partial [Ginsengibacter sp.]
LEMKGEKVDLNSIKNSVVEEMKGVKERVSKLGQEAGNIAKEKGGEFGTEVHYAAKRTSGILGNIIITFFKIFAYFILGCIAFSLIIALFALAIVSIGLFPLKDFVLTNGWQNVLAWGTLIFFIGVPVIGIITFIIRRIGKINSRNRLIRYSFFSLWILGIICFISLLFSIGGDFRRSSSVNEEKIDLTNPAVIHLEVIPFTNNNYNRSNSWFRLEPFATFDEDTAYIGNVRIKIEKSLTDSFEVSVIKMCNGYTRKDADTLAHLIRYNVSQNDSVLLADRAIPINTNDKFRNQSVQLIIYVPIGRYIKINKGFRYSNYIRVNGPWNHDEWFSWDDDNGFDYKYGVEYIMKEDGLYTLYGVPSGRENDWNEDNDNDINPATGDQNYRYDPNSKADSLRKIKEQQIQKIQFSVDSLKREKEKEINRLK